MVNSINYHLVSFFVRCNIKTGKRGEEIARKLLVNKGYKILEMNYRSKVGEIDIIAIHRNVVVFVEVKTRHSLKYGRPVESITQTKVRHIQKTANWYINVEGPFCDGVEFRFDVVEVLLIDDKSYVNHMENVF